MGMVGSVKWEASGCAGWGRLWKFVEVGLEKLVANVGNDVGLTAGMGCSTQVGKLCVR